MKFREGLLRALFLDVCVCCPGPGAGQPREPEAGEDPVEAVLGATPPPLGVAELGGQERAGDEHQLEYKALMYKLDYKAGMYELEYEARQSRDIELEAAGIGNPRLMSVDKAAWVATRAGRQRYTLPSIMSKHNAMHKMHLSSIYPSHI